MASTMTDFYMDIVLQMISMIAYTTIIIRITWLFVPNRFPKLPADKKWPSYVITSLYFLIIALLLTTFGLYYLDDSRDFGDEFREMDRVIEKTEMHITSTKTSLSLHIGHIPQIRIDGLEGIIDKVKTSSGFEDFNPALNQSEFEYFLSDIAIWRIQGEDCGGGSREEHDKIDELISLRPDILKFHENMVTKFGTIHNHFKTIINHENVELNESKSQITSHLKSTDIFFENISSSLLSSKNGMVSRKNGSIKRENSRNAWLLMPLSTAIVFALLSIIASIKWEKDMPFILSVILCILFYMLSIQVITISTYFAYDVPEDIFTQEPDYFKLFNFELLSYDNKSITNAYKKLLACDDKNGAIFSTNLKGIVLPIIELLPNLFGDLMTATHNEFRGVILPHLENITELKGIVDKVMTRSELVDTCTFLEEYKQNYSLGIREVSVFLNASLALESSLRNIENCARVVAEEAVEIRRKSIYGSISGINQMLIAADFKCHSLYNAFLNAYISSHQPDQNVYRDMFKITVMGGSTLCLILYLLALGKRINQTCDSNMKKNDMDSDKHLGDAIKDSAPRSPKRF